MRHQERGLSVWPFVICLVLTLIFGFLWYSEKSDREKLAEQRTAALKDAADARAATATWEEYVAELTNIVGYGTKSVNGKTVTDPEKIKADLDPANAGGAIGKLATAAKFTALRGVFPAKAGGIDGKESGVVALTAEFKQKIADAEAAFPGEIPAMPDDPDDAAGMAKWKSDKEAWDAKYKAYQEKLDAVSRTTDWPVYRAVIGAIGLFDADQTQTVSYSLFVKPTTETVEEMLKRPAEVATAFNAILKERVEALMSDLKKAKEEIAKLEAKISSTDAATPGFTEQLAKVQQDLADTTSKLQAEAAAARAALETERVAKTTAENEAAKEKQDRKTEVAQYAQKLKAEEDARLMMKQKRDLEIERDDVDGIVLAADNNLGIAYVNLGFADKAYAGLKLQVSYNSRGMIRTSKGTVVITKVLDQHYAQARIVGLVDGERPISKGDMLSNPFYKKSERLKIVVAGVLRKYPKSVAADRLRTMGTDLQDAIDATTDYVVIPDSIKVPTEGAAPAEGDAAAGTQSEYDRLAALAKSFGATLITEKLLEAFLDY
ncbi:MAG: hypothetical protein JNM10_11205 [Planctomycetia bacterium]|nr:hypothetical protein [Planctomycetia bacterium]